MAETSGFTWVVLAAVTVGSVVALVVLTFLRSAKRARPATDPVVEAGFYYAYGQKQRAMAILEQAQRDNPERQDIARQLTAWRNE
jgi:hypothetical protein